MNNAKAFLMLAALTALLVVIGGALGGRAGLLIALVFAGVMNFSAYWYSDTIVLKMYRAEPITPNHPSGVHAIVAQLANTAQLPMPKVYLIEDSSPNAFATGRNPEHAGVAVTSGLMRMLTKEELTGVLAHEMSHVLHRDTLVSMVAATIAGAISGVANMFMWASVFGHHDEDGPSPLVGILMSIFAPMAAMLIQMAISRSREFAADATGAKLCGDPLSLARALERIEYASRHGQFEAAEEHPATAHLFIINPLNGRKMAELFSTHPLTEERVRRLKAMA